ncbi:NUDIX family hydrolase [Thraustotheca clavata]|uniref:NUDIX family hydrolase n=1 Tax=Thraustotheca clavata TaxID=74557 RepID=A0A1W0A9G9_9STRA|nr:NUDIX family hydrolase [Thraustotheca clavata]
MSFVTTLEAALSSSPAKSLPGARVPRASVAAVLRVDGDRVQLLFIRRAVNPRDRWSGHIAFPGGKAEEGETSVATAIREAHEEIGLDLSSAQILGQLNDRVAHKLIVSTHVFLLPSAKVPPFVLQTSEVSAVFWVDIAFLATSPPQTQPIPLEKLIKRPSFYQRWLGSSIVNFPCIYLPSPVSHDQEQNQDKYVLWGLTFGMTMDLLRAGGVVRVKGPIDMLLLAWKHAQYHALPVLVSFLVAIALTTSMAKL